MFNFSGARLLPSFLRPMRCFDPQPVDPERHDSSIAYWNAKCVEWDKVTAPLRPDDVVISAYERAFSDRTFDRYVAQMLVLGSTTELAKCMLQHAAYEHIGPLQTSLTFMDSSQDMLLQGMRKFAERPVTTYSSAIHAVRKDWVSGLHSTSHPLDLVVADGSFNVLPTSEYRAVLTQLRRLMHSGGVLMVRFYDREFLELESRNGGITRMSYAANRATAKSNWNVQALCSQDLMESFSTYSFPPLKLFLKLLAEYGFQEEAREYAHHGASRMFPIIRFRQV